jgi:RNA polymerase sigma-70 factor (ECF subfamily)
VTDSAGQSSDLASISDEVIVGRIASGDSGSLGVLYDRYGRLAYGLAFRMLADGTAAEDVVQEAYLAVWRNAATFDPARGAARGWLMTSVRNRCIDILRGPRRPLKFDEPMEDMLDLRAADDVWETVLQNLQAQDVRKALDNLPDDQRTTIDLAYFGGLTQTQIAAQMRVPLGTVKGRMRLALEKLRELLANGRGFEPAVEGR